MRNNMFLLIFLTIILTSCSQKIDETDLIGGTWTATAGYEDGKLEGEPYCVDFMMEGLAFKEKGIVYSELYGEDYSYFLEERREGMTVVVKRKDVHYTYFIDKIDDDGIGLRGTTDSEESCYLERQK